MTAWGAESRTAWRDRVGVTDVEVRAGQGDDLVAAPLRRLAHIVAQHAGGAGDQDSHRCKGIPTPARIPPRAGGPRMSWDVWRGDAAAFILGRVRGHSRS